MDIDGISLAPLLAPSLDPLFWRPSRLGVDSAWYGHVPFAHWLVRALRPGCLVELGSFAGLSYAAFCDAVLRERTGTRCYAIDTWRGDDHNGFYGDEVFDELSAFHADRYAEFSTLLRCTFDEAVDNFADGSIDLLHIDGRHGYEDVLHDFTSWESKLSSRAVVLFHDTNERTRGFGVWRLWEELRARTPGFEFLHAHGLGILAYGRDIPPPVQDLIGGFDADRVRERFAALGERWRQDFLRRHEAGENTKMQAVIEDLGRAAEAAHADATRRIEHERGRVEKQEVLFEAQKTELLRQTASLTYDVENLRNDLTHATAELSFVLAKLAWTEGQLAGYQIERDIIFRSTTWRAVMLLKRIVRRIPRPLLRLAMRLRGRALSGSATSSDASETAATPQGAISPPIPAKPTATPRPAPVLRKLPGQRIIFISGEADTPGHDYRVMRAVATASVLGWAAEALTVESATDARLDGADIVVIWRATWSEDLNRIFGTCRKLGAVTIFDVDDLMFRPELARVKLIDGIRSQGLQEVDVQRFYVRINQSVRAADLCSCTTSELASHLRLFKKPSFVVPNCWDDDTWRRSRLAVRTRRAREPDGLLRIGYASGTRTHQKDFALAAGAVARVLRDNQDARLVLFRDPNSLQGIVVAEEFDELADVQAQIEWRDKVALSDLAGEMARFDINLAPLEIGNPFCEAKSELKYWEAALVEVPTIASPTGPFKRAIEHGRTGYLATTEAEWLDALHILVRDAALRRRVAHAASLDVLWRFGPLRHEAAMFSLLDQAGGSRRAARAMLLDLLADEAARPAPHLPEREIVFEHDGLGQAEVTVIVPVYNYAHYVRDALESVAAQTAEKIDLVVVDDASKDASLAVVTEWARAHADRFNRLLVLRHVANAGLGLARNTGFDAAETPYVLPLDADNMLRPECAARLAAALRQSGAAFAYPTIQRFGTDSLLIGDEPFLAARLVSGNYIDAMALVRRDAWAAAGGYDHVRFGWEDYDFWCRLVERGLWGEHVPEVLADYRAHDQSMLHTQTDLRENKIALIGDMKKRHPWLDMTAMTL